MKKLTLLSLLILLFLAGCSKKEATQTPVNNIITESENFNELIFNMQDIPVYEQMNEIKMKKNALYQADKVTFEFLEDAPVIDGEVLRTISKCQDKTIVFKTENKSHEFNENDFDLARVNNKWGTFFDVNQLIADGKMDLFKAMHLFEVEIVDIKEDGYEAISRRDNINSNLVMHLISKEDHLNIGDCALFYAPMDVAYFDNKTFDVYPLELRKVIKPTSPLPFAVYGMNEWAASKIYYAKGMNSLDVTLDPDEVNLPLNYIDFKNTMLNEIILNWRNQSFTYNRGLQKDSYPDGMVSYKTVHLPLVFANQHLGKEEEVNLESALVLEVNETGFVAQGLNSTAFYGHEVVTVAIVLETIEPGDYVEITYNYDEEKDQLKFYYVEHIPAPPVIK